MGGYASQVLPRQDGPRLERDQACRRRRVEQESGWTHPQEAYPCAHRARPPLHLSHGLLQRVAENEKVKKAAKESGVKGVTKSQPTPPRTACFVKKAEVETLFPVPYAGIST